MTEWLDESDPWEVDGIGKYPVLGRPGEFVYLKYDPENENETCEDLLMRHHEYRDRKSFWAYGTAVKYCEKCDECLKGSECDYYASYAFYEIFDSLTKKKYYLVCDCSDPGFMEEDEYLFIPAHPFNIKIFMKNYLDEGYKLY